MAGFRCGKPPPRGGLRLEEKLQPREHHDDGDDHQRDAAPAPAARLGPADLGDGLGIEAHTALAHAVEFGGEAFGALCKARQLTGKAAERGVAGIDDIKDARLKKFRKALIRVMKTLAQMIVRDGEGATKFVTVEVTGARNGRAARHIAMAIANSPLVKTAIAGQDANWGRVVMAVGKSEQPIDVSKIRIGFGGIDIAVGGMRDPNYDEAPVAAHLKGQEIGIDVDVGIGSGQSTVWTCDLTHGYISINADYRS